MDKFRIELSPAASRDLDDLELETVTKVLSDLKQTKNALAISQEQIEKVLMYSKDYLEDAKYYKAQQKLEISLTSIAYCEGLLDALKLLGAIQFEWPTHLQRIS